MSKEFGEKCARAAEACVESVLSCELSSGSRDLIYDAFKSISTLRLCFTLKSGRDVLLSSNLTRIGEVLFTPVEASSSYTGQGASQMRPALLSCEQAVICSDLVVPVRQDLCSILFCVPVLFQSEASEGQSSSNPRDEGNSYLGSLIVGFPSKECFTENDMRAALIVAHMIAMHHHGTLEGLLSSIDTVFHPTQTHPQWGDAGGLLAPQNAHPGEYHHLGGVDEDDDGRGGFIITPVQHALIDNADKLTLVFENPVLEEQYQEWRSARMARVDVPALATLLAYHATRTATSSAAAAGRNGSSSRSSSNGSVIMTDATCTSEDACPAAVSLEAATAESSFPVRSEWLPCIALTVLLILAMLPFTQKWYARKRDMLIAFLYAVLAWHHTISNPNPPIKILPPESRPLEGINNVYHAFTGASTPIMNILSSVGGVWVAVLSVILHVQHPWQVIMLLVATAVSFWSSAIACAKGAMVALCLAAVLVRTLVIQIIAPTVVLYMLEYGARKAFCATPTATAYAWRVELQRSG